MKSLENTEVSALSVGGLLELLAKIVSEQNMQAIKARVRRFIIYLSMVMYIKSTSKREKLGSMGDNMWELFRKG